MLADALDSERDEALYRKIRGIVDIYPTADIEAAVGNGSLSRFREESPVDLAQSTVMPDQGQGGRCREGSVLRVR